MSYVYIETIQPYDFKNKKKCVNDYNYQTMTKLLSMFEYKGLPETIPQDELEKILLQTGCACVTEVDGKLYAFFGSMGGKPDVYYHPTEFIVNNAPLNFNKNLEIGKDCVLIKNNSFLRSVTDINSKYATMLVENDLSLRNATINARAVALLNAKDERTKESGVEYLRQLESGNIGIIGSNMLLDSLQSTVLPTTTPIKDLIEARQYYQAQWMNELGLDSNFNMKREALNSSETNLNDAVLLPMTDDMLKCRKEAIEEINKMYGTNITVDFASSWKLEHETQNEKVSDNEQEINKESGDEYDGNEKNE